MKKPGNIAELEEALGHKFARAELLQQALTHSSYANEQHPPDDRPNGAGALDNEQLEFLGDAVLGFVTSRCLFERFPAYTEGQLSKARAHLVSARHLIKIARHLGLGDFLALGKGEERSGGRHKSALLVDSLEAVIAALFLDGGLETARNFILGTIVGPELERISRDPEKALAMSDQKSALQEWLQANGRPQPAYQVVREEGPDHNKLFTVELQIPTGEGEIEHVTTAEGPTKKKAEQKAAQSALKYLRRQESASNQQST